MLSVSWPTKSCWCTVEADLDRHNVLRPPRSRVRFQSESMVASNSLISPASVAYSRSMPLNFLPTAVATIALLLLFAAPLPAIAEHPVAEKPRVFIDTIYRHPSGATLWVGKDGDLQATLNSAQPGDTIVIDAETTYTGNFTLPAKSNPGQKWIYIESSAIAKLPAPGMRVSPADGANMPKIVTPNSGNAFTIASGGGYVRLVGIEMYSTSTYLAEPSHQPHPINGFTYYLLFGSTAANVTVDRCYLHGSDTQDVNHAIGFTLNSSYVAVVDSDIRDIHGGKNDSQAFIAFSSPGPFKLVNNYLSASTEDVMFGGAGGYANPHVPSDIEIRGNHFFKPPEWEIRTTAPGQQWIVKNNFECKACLRALVTGNVMENAWYSGDQVGSNILLTPRTGQSGYNSVDNDITIENNILKNANFGFTISGYDSTCTPPACSYLGETKRVVIRNNLILTRDAASKGGYHPLGFSMGRKMDSILIQHNTVQGIHGSQPWGSFYFGATGCPSNGDQPTNLWILDNALSRQPTGDCGYQGQKALDSYIPLPAPSGGRFRGNAMFSPASDKAQPFPAGNVSLGSGAGSKDRGNGEVALLSSNQARTTDATPVGVDMSKIDAARVLDHVPPPEMRPEVVMLRAGEKAEFHSASGSPSAWRFTPDVGSITDDGLYTAPSNVKRPLGVTLCTGGASSDSACASIVLLPSH